MKIKHHFFGKECVIDRALTDYSNLEKNLSKQNFSSSYPAVFVNQIHSSDVFVIDKEDKIPALNNRPKADAIVTNLKNLIIGVITADCTPILFFDEQAGVIGAAHAGWRGAFGSELGDKSGDVIENTILAMQKLGAKVGNIKAKIGPTIRQQSYQVSREFYDTFLKTDKINQKFFIADAKPEHYLFDLPAYVKMKLKKAGIENIVDEGIDTYSEVEKFFSYRRSTHLGVADCGRNVSVISLCD